MLGISMYYDKKMKQDNGDGDIDGSCYFIYGGQGLPL